MGAAPDCRVAFATATPVFPEAIVWDCAIAPRKIDR
jgi:hypothetical protein